MSEQSATPTDAEVISMFMEARPSVPIPPFEFWQGKPSARAWWRLASNVNAVLEWRPTPLDLDALHEVEARLTGQQWIDYGFLVWPESIIPAYRALVHLAAEQKIAALAEVIRQTRGAQ